MAQRGGKDGGFGGCIEGSGGRVLVKGEVAGLSPGEKEERQSWWWSHWCEVRCSGEGELKWLHSNPRDSFFEAPLESSHSAFGTLIMSQRNLEVWGR